MSPSPDRRAEVLRTADLEGLLTRYCGPPKWTGGKPWWPSPVSAGTGKTPPTHIQPGTGPSGELRWKDFASGHGGNAIDLVLLMEPHLDFRGALDLLDNESTAPSVASAGRTPDPRRHDVTAVPAGDEFRAWVEWTRSQLVDTKLGDQALGWMQAKGFPAENVIAAGVGFDPGHWRSETWPKDRRASHGISNAAGIVYPIADVDGTVCYAQTRNLDWNPESKFPKYFNPSGIINPHVGYWIGTASRGAPVVVVEGPSDAIAAWSAAAGGDEFAVAALIGAGVAQRDDIAAGLAAQWPGHPIVVATDPDNAGELAAEVLIANLARYDTPASRLRPSGGDIADWQLTDPDNFVAGLSSAVAAAVASTTHYPPSTEVQASRGEHPTRPRRRQSRGSSIAASI